MSDTTLVSQSSDPEPTVAPLTERSQEPSVPVSVRRRLVSVLFGGQSLYSAGQIVGFAVLPIVVVQMAGTESIAGVPATLTLIGRAIAAYPVGWLMDKFGRRFGLSLGFILCTVGALFSVFSIVWASLLGLLLCTLIGGMGRGIAEQARFAAAESEVEDRRAKAIGLVVFASTIGAILGPLLLAPSEQLADFFGLAGETGPFIIGAILFYFAFMLTILFLRPDPMLVGRALAAQTPEGQKEALADARPMRSIFADWNIRLSLIAMAVAQLVMTSIMIITPLHMAKLEYPLSDVQWVLMAHTLGMFGLAGVTGWLIDKTGSTQIIGAGALILIVAAILAPMASDFWLFCAALFLLGLGWNFCFVAGSALLSANLRSSERGRVQGASETIVSLASGIGSLSVGLLYAFGGIGGISGGAMIYSIALVVAIVWVVLLRPRPLVASGD